MTNLPTRHELLRKSIHLSSIWLPLFYYISGFTATLTLLLIATPIFICLDLLRSSPTLLGARIRGVLRVLFFDDIFRLHEKRGALSGASYMLIAALICLLIMPRLEFIAAFLVLILADTSAALMGTAFGKTKLLGDKTLVGSITFFATSIVISITMWHYFELSIWRGFLAAGLATLAELLAGKFYIDDNLLIPIIYGYCLTL